MKFWEDETDDGHTILRTKHTEIHDKWDDTAFHLPRQKCNLVHGAHNFAQSAGLSIHLEPIHPSFFHNGKPSWKLMF
jgi:hypothetical protein